MRDQGNIQFNPEHTWLFPPQKWQGGFWVATAWTVWMTGGDGYYNNWHKQLSGPVSQPFVSHFQEKAFCSQSYKRPKHPSGEGKALEPGMWQLLVRIKKAIGQVSQDPLPSNAAWSQEDRCSLVHDPDMTVVFGPQLLITFYDFI